MPVLDPSIFEENQMVERKEAFNERGLKTLCAFLNTDGGSLYVPVRDNGEVLETPLTDEQQQNIANQIIDGLGVQPSINTHSWDDKEFIEIQVSKAQNPVPFKGSYYLRVGNTTQRMNPEQLRVRILKNVPWDSQLIAGSTMDDLDIAEIKRFVRAGQEAGRISTEVDPNDPGAILRQTNLIRNSVLTNAAILLFGQNPQQLFPSARVRIGVFATEDDVIDDKMADGHLFHQIRRSEEILKSHIQHGYEITDEEFTRKEDWEYPLPAFREGIMNAVIHRDYHRQGAEVQIKLFPDHLSIFSPGGLPNGLNVDELLEKHPSIKRNNLLADIFYRAGLIETFGTGISRIQRHLKEADLPEPKLDDRDHSFVLTFSQRIEKPVIADEEVLNERQLKALELAQKGRIKTSDVQELYPDIDPSTIRRDFRELVEKRLLKAMGTTSARFYILKS